VKAGTIRGVKLLGDRVRVLRSGPHLPKVFIVLDPWTAARTLSAWGLMQPPLRSGDPSPSRGFA
jgi:hypothetical protein